MAHDAAGHQERPREKNTVHVPFAVGEYGLTHLCVALPAILGAYSKEIVVASLHLAVHRIASQVPRKCDKYQEVDDRDDGEDLIAAHQPSDPHAPRYVRHP